MKTRNGGEGQEKMDDLLAVVSGWFSDKRALPAEWKKELDAIKSLSITELRQRPDLKNRAQDIGRRLLFLSETLKALSIAIGDESDAFQVTSRKCGLSLLPNDSLAMIFDYVVNGEEYSWRRPRASQWVPALKLSHVCQHFRAVSLSCPRLWMKVKGIWSNMAVELCLSRSGNAPLSVESIVALSVENEAGGWSFDHILGLLSPQAKRLEQLSIIFNTTIRGTVDSDVATYQTLRQLDAPLLEELYLDNAAFGGYERSEWDWTQWKTPKLRRIDAICCSPRLLPGLANVSCLYLTLHIDDEFIVGSLLEVSKMANLRDFTFILRNSEEWEGDRIEAHERVEFSRVERLLIGDQLNFPYENRTPALKRALFSSLFFPCVTHLELEIFEYGFDSDEIDWEDDPLRHSYFNKEMQRIFRHIEQFPKLKNFHLKVFSENEDCLGSSHSSYLDVPLKMFPRLKHFTLESDMRLEMRAPAQEEEITFADERRVAPRVLGKVKPVLETITLDMYSVDAAAAWIGGYLRGLRGKARWSGFQELIVIRGDELEGRRRESYVGDKALEWAESYA